MANVLVGSVHVLEKVERRLSVDEEKAREIWKCEDQESTQRPDSDVAEKE